MPPVGSQLERNQRLFLSKVGIDYQRRFCVIQVGHGRECRGLTLQCVQQRGNITGAVMIDIRRTQNLPGKFLQQVIFFVGRVIRSYDAESDPCAPSVR